jgi:precorrin-6B methylase 2
VTDSSPDDWDVHWERFGDAAQDNPANEYRLRLILQALHLSDTDRLLDIGSGQGALAMQIARLHPGLDVCGIEYSATGVERSRVAAAANGLSATFLRADLLAGHDAVGVREGWATAAVCSEVLEHVDRPDDLLRNAAHFVAPGGRIVITVPGGPRTAFDRHIGHRRHFRSSDLQRVIEAAGLEAQTICRAGFPFFNLYKLAVMLRGRKLITDLEKVSGPERQRTSDLAMSFFRRSFHLNLSNSPAGWQLLAVAAKPVLRQSAGCDGDA